MRLDYTRYKRIGIKALLGYIIQDIKVIVNFVLSESHISIKSNFFDAILRNSPFEEGFSKQISNDA